ncbi:FAD-dependent monooxygenase [Pendulispora rubella]|uniref:FAD-dependent monooxygenase n=1 Tax=Pendulispora rubella TaxID=2741070 RepID=A0ABZ2L4Y1_9BACT
MQNETVDVAIAGAGPAGLLLAIELVLGGASVVVLERLAAPDETIKAGAVGALAGEALERRGFGPDMDAEERTMLEAFRAMAKSTGPAGEEMAKKIGKIGGHFAGLFLIDQTRQREPHRRFRGIRQQPLERMLGDRVRAMGIEVRRGHELTDFHDDGQGVQLQVRTPEGARVLRCAYLVGCDGGRSVVRKRAGFEFPGTDPTITGHQAIVELDHPERLLPLGWRRTPVGMLAFGPVPGRIFVVQFEGPPPDRDAPITRDEVEGALRRVSGADVRITSMSTATRFTDNARQATEYRRGRVLLAGDAAHVHSPFGGQGLNLGLLDAVNLGWKLAATLRGWAPAGILDTYTAERHGVAAAVLENTRAQIALMRPDVFTTALRNVVTGLMDLDEGNRFFGDMMSGLRTRYDFGSDDPQVGTYVANLALAQPDRETGLYSWMQEGGGLLVDATGGTASTRSAPWSSRVRTVRVERGTSLLIRPDGCIAWTSAESNMSDLDAALARWFGEPVTPV